MLKRTCEFCQVKYEQWKKNPIRFVAMTGYSMEQFGQLLPYFKEAHDTYVSRYQMNGKRRKGIRKFVMYANSPLPSVEERLAFILSYLKLNPLQEQHADLFDMQQKQCYEFVHGLRTILDQALELASAVPAQTNSGLQDKLTEMSAALIEQATTTCVHLLHDATERDIPRPQDDQSQQEHYSGKKKKHTVKNGVVTTLLCLILFVSPTVAGSTHDKRIADHYYSIPQGCTLWQDCGYQGYHPQGVDIHQPKKKPRTTELTKEQKELNRYISSFRVRVEHAIGSVKRYRIVKDECRLRKNNFVDKVFLCCAALHNFRILQQPFNYKIKMT
jgi:DDE superfamily endonuclease/Helix-turn-helix of DDE superfamily endonuclease